MSPVRFTKQMVCILLLLSTLTTTAQKNRFIQFDLSAGISEPVHKFRTERMFAGRGIVFTGGFDYFFGRFGVGFSGGNFYNQSQNLFNNYIASKYYEGSNSTDANQWNTKFALLGPSYKLSLSKFELDFFAKTGFSQISVPDLFYKKTFFNQSYEVYHFTGTSDDWQLAWSAGMRLNYKLNKWLGIQLKSDVFTTSYFSKISYDNTFRDASDANRNGIIDDAEYFESQRITTPGRTDLTVANLQMGVIIQLGKKMETPVTTMIPQTIIDDIALSQTYEPTVLPENQVAEPALDVKEDLKEEFSDDDDIISQRFEDIPIVNAYEETDIKQSEFISETTEIVPIPNTTYDAPESKFDDEAAEFLYKAGESYFATNDFENAMPCFNKLKADPKYPRAKYMFALSLCAMGNCAEAKIEYKEFATRYKETDSRTLEIIFASHHERCSMSGKLVVHEPVAKHIDNENKSKVENKLIDERTKKRTSSDKTLEYKIQFIAIKKSDETFPKVADIGDISSEYFPSKKVYRYTIGDYTDINVAAKDVYKVRKMGFRDAFVAVYEDGIRVNTLYHAK
ncbi:MAG: hypothetical protein WAU01_13060 [Saprospiraceae bacterium]